MDIFLSLMSTFYLIGMNVKFQENIAKDFFLTTSKILIFTKILMLTLNIRK